MCVVVVALMLFDKNVKYSQKKVKNTTIVLFYINTVQYYYVVTFLCVFINRNNILNYETVNTPACLKNPNRINIILL